MVDARTSRILPLPWFAFKVASGACSILAGLELKFSAAEVAEVVTDAFFLEN